jgi:hypothetical protein
LSLTLSHEALSYFLLRYFLLLIFAGINLFINSFTLNGSIDNIHTAKRIGQGNAISPTFLSARERIILAALSASIKNGIGHVFWSVIRERTNPGHIAETEIFSFRKIPLIASAQVFIQLFVAEYDGHDAIGPYPAIDAVISI